MKTPEEIMMHHCSDNGLLSVNLGKSILAAMREYGDLRRTDAVTEFAEHIKDNYGMEIHDMIVQEFLKYGNTEGK